MDQNFLVRRYTSKFGGNVQGITTLAATIKRTSSALGSIKNGLSDSLTQEERATLLESMAILGKLAIQANNAKREVKRHAAEKQKLQERLKKEAAVAVAAAFNVGEVDDAVAFLAWDNNLRIYFSDGSWKLKLRKQSVIGEVRIQAEQSIRDLIGSVANEAELKGCAVSEVAANALADFNTKRPAIMEKWQQLIQEIKAVGVAQALEKAGQA